MTTFAFSNFGSTTLSAALDGASTTILVPPTESALLPGPLGASEVFAAIIRDGIQDEEIVHCTANPGTGVLTVLRGQEGTAAHSWGVGSLFEHTLTAESIGYFTSGGNLDWKADLEAQIAALTAQIAALTAALAANAAADAATNLTVSSTFEDAFSQVQVLSSAVTDNNLAMANFQISVNAQLASFSASVTTQLAAIVTVNSSQASSITTLNAFMGSTSATLTSLLSVNVTQNSAIVQLQTDLTAATTNFGGRITSLESLRLTDYNALASSITTLNVSMGTLSASVTATQTAVANINGNLTATYGFVLDAGGVVTSFEALAGTGPAGGAVSYVKWGLNKFIIDTPAGTKQPFEYDAIGGTLTVQNLKVLGSLIYDNTIATGPMAPNAVTKITSGYDTAPFTIPATIGAYAIVDAPFHSGLAGSSYLLDIDVWIEPKVIVDVALGSNPLLCLKMVLYNGDFEIGQLVISAGQYVPDTGSTNGYNLIVPGGLKHIRIVHTPATVGVDYAVTFTSMTDKFTQTVDYRYITVHEFRKA